MSKTIAFRTAAQAAIFEHEIKGQLSDGHWENDPQCDWRAWSDADVIVDPENVGRNFFVNGRKTFGLDNPTLTKVVGDRMRLYAVLARAGYTNIDVAEKAFEFCSCEPIDEIPQHGGKYWENVRRELATMDLPRLHEEVADGLTTYRKKELLADLRDMKAIMGTQHLPTRKAIEPTVRKAEILDAIEPVSEITPLMYALEDATRQLELTKEQLIRKAQNLADDMESVVFKLENNQGTVNSLGEVQGQGAAVDRLCGLMAEQTRVLETFQRLNDREEGEPVELQAFPGC